MITRITSNYFTVDNEYVNPVQDFLPGAPKERAEYLGGKIKSKFGKGYSIVDTEITQIRTRKKIFRDPNLFLQSIMNERSAVSISTLIILVGGQK